METAPMDERARFVAAVRRRGTTIAALCGAFGVSRKTGHKWLQRHNEGGDAGLADRSRAPKSCPHRLEDRVAAAIVDVRLEHPTWGPKKILGWLATNRPEIERPAASTA